METANLFRPPTREEITKYLSPSKESDGSIAYPNRDPRERFSEQDKEYLASLYSMPNR